MDEMKKIEVLSMSHNKLRKLPQSIYDIESLQNLDIDENDFADSPPPTLEQQSFQDYLELEENIEHLGSDGWKEGDEIEFVSNHKVFTAMHTFENQEEKKLFLLEEYIEHLGSAGLKEGDEIEFVTTHKKYKTVHTDETRRINKLIILEDENGNMFSLRGAARHILGEKYYAGDDIFLLWTHKGKKLRELIYEWGM